jgi:hypothetical protein
MHSRDKKQDLYRRRDFDVDLNIPKTLFLCASCLCSVPVGRKKIGRNKSLIENAELVAYLYSLCATSRISYAQ